MSTKPGVTSAPSASSSRRPAPSTLPTSATTPSVTATSAVRGAAPVPSTSVPPRITRSWVIRPLYHCGCVTRTGRTSDDAHRFVRHRGHLGEPLAHRKPQDLAGGRDLAEQRPEVGLREHRGGDRRGGERSGGLDPCA